MIQTADIDIILARRREIAAKIEELRIEDGELEIAIKVLQRFSKSAPNGAAIETEVSNRLGPPRPPNTPSLFEMTEAVLREAIAAGKPGLKGQEIVAHIGKTYWPGVLGRQILPPIYGFVKNQRIQKGKDGIFKPVQKWK